MTATGIEAAPAFWAWWDGAKVRVEEALTSGDWGELAAEITAAVGALDPALQWELAPGELSTFTLCLSGSAAPELRALAERVVRAGPEPDATWSYSPVRLPHPGSIEGQVLAFADEQVDLGDVRFSILVDEEREVLDLVVHHPAFGRFDEHQRATVAFLVIDGLLGEDGVERWIGTVDLSADELPDGLPADALAEAVDGMADRHAEPTWALLTGTEAGRALVILARRPLKRVDAPLFDLHATVMMIGYATNEDGMPTKEAYEHLSALEDGLAAALGDDALVAAHVTVGGRRTTHLYCDQYGPAPALISAWTTTLADDVTDAVVSFDLDPAWDAVQPFR